MTIDYGKPIPILFAETRRSGVIVWVGNGAGHK